MGIFRVLETGLPQNSAAFWTSPVFHGGAEYTLAQARMNLIPLFVAHFAKLQKETSLANLSPLLLAGSRSGV